MGSWLRSMTPPVVVHGSHTLNCDPCAIQYRFGRPAATMMLVPSTQRPLPRLLLSWMPWASAARRAFRIGSELAPARLPLGSCWWGESGPRARAISVAVVGFITGVRGGSWEAYAAAEAAVKAAACATWSCLASDRIVPDTTASARARSSPSTDSAASSASAASASAACCAAARLSRASRSTTSTASAASSVSASSNSAACCADARRSSSPSSCSAIQSPLLPRSGGALESANRFSKLGCSQGLATYMPVR